MKKFKIEHTKLQVIGMSQELHIFFSRMKNDIVTQTAANDSLIKDFVSQQLLSKGMRNFTTVSEKTRVLSTFLMDFRRHTSNENLSLQDLLKPANLDDIRTVILLKFEYNSMNEKHNSTVTVQRPSTLIKLGQSLIQISDALLRHYLKNSERTEVENTENLIKLLNSDLRPLMANAHLSLNNANLRPEDLPEADDLSTSINHIHLILTSFLKTDVRKLKNASMTFLILYDKRRSTEVSALEKKTWEERHIWKKRAMNDIPKMNAEETEFLKDTEIVYVRGRGNRFVPVLFPKIVVPVINYLANLTDNYIFSNTVGMFIRGNDALRSISKEAGIPLRSISSTKFRKHAATSLQLEDFHENDFRMLCRHLGHTAELHNRWYRMSDVTIELTKVGKMLEDHYEHAKSGHVSKKKKH